MYWYCYGKVALSLLLFFFLIVIFLCRTLIHELLKKLDSYLWSQRSGSLAPKVKYLSSYIRAVSIWSFSVYSRIISQTPISLFTHKYLPLATCVAHCGISWCKCRRRLYMIAGETEFHPITCRSAKNLCHIRVISRSRSCVKGALEFDWYIIFTIIALQVPSPLFHFLSSRCIVI